MSSNRMKIEVNGLREGMFVADLDRPWHETPFPLQGFYIQQDDDIKKLSQYCSFVYVDVKRQKTSSYAKHSPFTPADKQKKTSAQDANILKLPPVVIKKPEHYTASSTIKKELGRASKLHRHVYEAIDNVFAELHAGGTVSIKETETVANGMVESVVTNPDALVWLAKMSDEDTHSYRHSINASIWALVFGRHLGLDKKRLKILAMGVLLSHIGKVKLSSELIENAEFLDGAELAEYRSYVNHSVALLEEMEGLPKGVDAIVAFHQERHNGSGFPAGATGDRIPLLAKIAGIVEHYQNLITPRDYAQGLSPLDAVSVLYDLRNVAFQGDLVEKFIEAVGVYPTGTLVELSSNEVGIVTGHNAKRRLLPKVMVILDKEKQPLKAGKLVDLKEFNERQTDKNGLFIRDSLPKGAYDINETEYLLTGAKSKWSWQHIKGSLATG